MQLVLLGRSSQLEERDWQLLWAVSKPGKDCTVCKGIVNSVLIFCGPFSTVGAWRGRREACGFARGVWRRERKGRRGRFPAMSLWIWNHTWDSTLSHGPVCISLLLISPGGCWVWARTHRMQLWACLVEALCHSGPAELRSCKDSVLSLPLPGHPTLPQPYKGL